MPQFTPIANPDAVITTDQARFTILTSRLIRMEWQENGRFIDAPSQAFWYRRQPVPNFTAQQDGQTLTITTDHLILTYHGGPFIAESLTISNLQSPNLQFTWHFGDCDPANLLGTTRTLDNVSGNTELEQGLISPTGWAVVDDSRTLVFTEDGWLTPRPDDAGLDVYFFGYGRAYHHALRDFTKIAGAVPMIPRYAFGNWWSRYWAYTQDELQGLMRDFMHHNIPLSVCIIDMDWHLDGWTGYTWNHTLFPDPDGLIQWLHENGLRTALNLHPADGVGPHEAQYEAIAKRLGIDPSSKQPVPFDIASRSFARAYFEELHHPEEARGIDFWWIDWQQGEVSGLPGLDPLWWLNHLHYYDLARDGKRPFIFSRWGGLGNHRYPIGFSGDTYVNWETLAFQPYFTATAANVQYGWWSHDIGGHQRGVEDGELYTRWVQFGVFSPIMRLHSTKNPFHDRRPWAFDANVEQATGNAMRLRHRLIPYLYTLNWQHHTTAVPPIRPMYHDYPHADEAYACPQQYTFGSSLIAAPFTAPADKDTRLSRQVVWLPKGEWYHFFTGEAFTGNGWHAIYGRLDDIPVFARAGTIVPLGPEVGWGGIDNPAQLHLQIFAGADGEFTLYEDDGETQSYLQGDYAQTTFRQQWAANESASGLHLEIEPATGSTNHIPRERIYHADIFGITEPESVVLKVNGRVTSLPTRYDPTRECLTTGPIRLAPTDHAAITITAALARRSRTQETVTTMLTHFRLQTDVKAAIADTFNEWRTQPGQLAMYQPAAAASQLRALLEVTQQAGVHYAANMRHPHQLVLWNNHQNPAFRYSYTDWYQHVWDRQQQYQTELGILPKFKALTPKHDWQITAVYDTIPFTQKLRD